jgi:two-component system sensor histidine kinase RegB
VTPAAAPLDPGAAAPSARAADRARHATNLAWLVRLRWVALATQIALVVAAKLFLHAHLSLPRLGLLGLAVAVSNVLLAAWVHPPRGRREASEGAIAAVLAFDLVVLTGLLVLSGGPFNPFSALYLVQVALAPVVLGARLSWIVVALAIVLFGLLFLQPAWLPTEGAVDHATQMKIHLRGMWLAFAVSALFVGYFVRKVRIAMDARDAELQAARAQVARDEKLAALATLAAGAAHELSTPLSTIAVASKELERRLGRAAPAGDPRELEARLIDARDDAALIRAQVERCRAVLEQMSADAGGSLGEAPATLDGEALLAELAREAEGASLRCAPEARRAEIRVPARATVRALRGLVKNAREACVDEALVAIEIDATPREVTVTVRDRGPGIDPERLARVGEPFFTTKEAGAGMGLGVFLARAVVERLGGALVLTSREGEGTTVRATLPRVFRPSPLPLDAAGATHAPREETR